ARGGGARLELGIGLEARACLLGLGQSERAGADDVDAERLQEIADLWELSRIVRGDDQASAGEAPSHRSQPSPRAARCRVTSWAMPRRASASISAKRSSAKGSASAVACTSTMPPRPVRTKLASASAVESSA